MHSRRGSDMLEYFNLGMHEFHIGKHPISSLIARYGTPLYVYDGEIIKRKHAIVKNAFPSFNIFYSMKANPNVSIASLLNSFGTGAEIASGGELHLALQAGFHPENVIFVGPGKTNRELEYAIKNDLYALVVESVNELKRVDTISEDLGKDTNVMIRVNTKSWEGPSPEIMVGGPSKLGIDEEKLVQLLNPLELNRIKIVGIHVYSASQILDETSLIESIEHILDLACYYSEKLKFDLKCVDFGGGWGVPYKEEEDVLDIAFLQDRIAKIVSLKSSTFDLNGTRLIFELGRYLVAESGVYLTQVIDIKESRGNKYLITDGGINQQIRPVFMNLNHPTLIVNKLNQKTEEIVQIGGPLCTPFDMLAKDVSLAKSEIGDIIGIFNSGAYGFSMSMLNFLSHPWPAEVLVLDDDVYLTRKRGTFENLSGEQTLIRF